MSGIPQRKSRKDWEFEEGLNRLIWRRRFFQMAVVASGVGVWVGFNYYLYYSQMKDEKNQKKQLLDRYAKFATVWADLVQTHATEAKDETQRALAMTNVYLARCRRPNALEKDETCRKMESALTLATEHNTIVRNFFANEERKDRLPPQSMSDIFRSASFASAINVAKRSPAGLTHYDDFRIALLQLMANTSSKSDKVVLPLLVSTVAWLEYGKHDEQNTRTTVQQWSTYCQALDHIAEQYFAKQGGETNEQRQ